MNKVVNTTSLIFISLFLLIACNKTEENNSATDFKHSAIDATFNGIISIDDVYDYQNEKIPAYITKANGLNNPQNNKKITLGRVLFYDVNLSVDNTVSCGSCHQQQFAFSDTAARSIGVNGLTGRHSMRLINARFSRESKFFWNERAASLEEQTTMPIQDHAEMGYSGQDGDPGIEDLIQKLNGIEYYQELVNWAYNDESASTKISEEKLQECLSQFIRSIQSFDSKYDDGRAMVNNNNSPFPNFSQEENQGMMLFSAPPTFRDSGMRIGGGLGCAGCHQAPEFDIDPNTRNNGFVGDLTNPAVLDLDNTRSPTLRDIVNSNGDPNGPMMHTASINSLVAVIGHYNRIIIRPGNNTIDPRLTPQGFPQQLNVTPQERGAVIAFLRTLTGKNIYTAEQWSNPFK